jgi:hypothetical protein
MTPQAGGKVDKTHPAQFGRILRQSSIEMIAACPPGRGLVRSLALPRIRIG